MRNDSTGGSPAYPFAPGYSWDSSGNDNYNWGGQGQGFGGGSGMTLGGDLGSMFGLIMGNRNYKNPADSAMQYFNRAQNPANGSMDYFRQIPGGVAPYLNPYMQQGQSTFPAYQNTINAGQNASNVLQGQYNRNINDPTSVMNQIGFNFQQSPGYNFQKQQMTNAANNAAAAGGFVGSPQAQQQMAQNIGGLANQDYWNYENHGLNQYNQGLQGMQGINQMGFNAMSDLGHMGQGASNSMAQYLADAFRNQGMMQFQGNEDMNQMLANMAQLQYAGQANKNQQNQGFWAGMGADIGKLI